MSAAAILDFQKFEILAVDPLKGASVRQRAKFHQNLSNGCRDKGQFNVFKNGSRPPS